MITGAPSRVRAGEASMTRVMVSVVGLWAALVSAALVSANQSGQAPPPPPQFVSPEILSDSRVAFRIHAPQAREVRLVASDIPGVGRDTQLVKGGQEVWEVTLGPLAAGAYRYTFNVDGVATVDPRNPVISESNNNVWSLVPVPGSDVFDTKPVPRGAIAEVTYHSTALGKYRRMHVYTPPGYELGRDRYPVFYLLHGAGDNDDSWSSVGRAGFILDNLIAAKRATPMVVVMPAGHTSRGPGSPIGRAATEEFVTDFTTAVMPYIEQHYRVLTDRANTAIAGLSMGGGQTLNIAIPRLERFAYIGVFSSGLIGAFPAPDARPGAAPTAAGPPASSPPSATEWEAAHAAMLDDAGLKKGLRLLWFATGKEDRLMPTTQATVDLLTKHRFAPVFKQSPGGHTWINWRNYLVEFVPELFHKRN
jgi:enterochelin esterase-like enzyme